MLFDGLIKKMKIASEIALNETVLIKNPKSLRRSFNCKYKSLKINPKRIVNPVLILLANADNENRLTATKNLYSCFSKKFATEIIVANSQTSETIFGGFDAENAGRPKAKEKRSM